MARSVPVKSGFVHVDGVRLQTLDWGGEGPLLVFLAGYANTPHFFDSIAETFTDRFRVAGLCRRAHGESDQPDSGYDTPTLARDVLGVLDAMGYGSASLVGHSFAGQEMCCLAAGHPDRVDRLVFLDALYDYTEEDLKILSRNPLPPAAPAPDTFPSVDAYCEDFVTRYASYRPLRSPTWDALWALGLERTPDGRVREKIRPETARKLSEGRSAFRPDYAAVRCPALAFFAFQNERWYLPEDASDALREAMAEYVAQVNDWVKRRCVERVRREMADVRVVELDDASHYCFLDRQRDVVREMRAFLC